MREAQRAELFDRVGRGDDGQTLVEFLRGDIIEMIAVVMRQHDHIDRWQIRDLTRRLDLTPCPYAVAQVDVLAFVKERGVGQDRQSAEPDQNRRVSDEVKIALIEICLTIAGEFQAGHRVRPFAVSASLRLWSATYGWAMGHVSLRLRHLVEPHEGAQNAGSLRRVGAQTRTLAGKGNYPGGN